MCIWMMQDSNTVMELLRQPSFRVRDFAYLEKHIEESMRYQDSGPKWAYKSEVSTKGGLHRSD